LLKEGVSALETVGDKFVGAPPPFRIALHRTMAITKRDLDDLLRKVPELCRDRLELESSRQNLEEMDSRLPNMTAGLCEMAEVMDVDPAVVASTERQAASVASSLHRVQSLLWRFEQMTDETLANLRQAQVLYTAQNEIPAALDESLGEPAADVCAFCLEGCHGHNIRLPCAHTFHSACALHWVHTKKTCPLCRVRVNRLVDCEFPETRSMP
jgi:Ring finger domain